MKILQLLTHIFSGMGSVMRIPSSSLYRYPYRATGEGLRGDWLKIGKDVEATMRRREEREE